MTRGECGSAAEKDRGWVTKGMEKAKIFGVFFTMVFTAMSSLQQSLTPGDQKESLKQGRLVLGGGGKHLNKLDRPWVHGT